MSTDIKTVLVVSDDGRAAFANEALVDGLLGYFNDHDPQALGGFLTACVENDFYRAVCNCGTPDDLKRVAGILSRVPRSSWGSREAVDKWLALVWRVGRTSS